MSNDLELQACKPLPVDLEHFNPDAVIPYGCTSQSIHLAMNDFIQFLTLINQELHVNGLPRFESILMPANFSSIVGEFMSTGIPKYCHSLAKNRYHNGHPDLIPTGLFVNDSTQHSSEGIEIKASRYATAWQGHNPEDTWLMVFVFDSNRPADSASNVPPRPFRFSMVLGARLQQEDWLFAGRSATSRRTITASVLRTGYNKMLANWIYRAPELGKG